MPRVCVRVVRQFTASQKRWKNLRGVMVANKAHLNANPNALNDPDHQQEDQDGGVEVLFLWTMQKFVGRLSMMRDIYHNWAAGESFTVDLKEDPWVEAGPVELDFWMSHKEDE